MANVPLPSAPPSPRVLTGALLFTSLGAVLLVTALGSLAMTGANLVGSGPDNTAAQHVMLCLGLFAGFAALASFGVAVVLRLLRR